MKRAKRIEIRKLLAEVSERDWLNRSQELCICFQEWLGENPEFKKIALFSALPTEVNLSLMTTLLPSVEWHYPAVKDSRLQFHRVSNSGKLETGYLGILEPNPQVHPPVKHEELDLVVCPGLGFTPNGARIGRGGGFYDRFLSTLPNVMRMGVCLPEQIFPDLPVTDYDVPMTHLLTVNGVTQVDTERAKLT